LIESADSGCNANCGNETALRKRWLSPADRFANPTKKNSSTVGFSTIRAHMEQPGKALKRSAVKFPPLMFATIANLGHLAR
jgi:hypothetical protein